MIDYNEIREKRPKAFWALDTFMESMACVSVTWVEMPDKGHDLYHPANPRDLFDFFDEQGVYVVIYRTSAGRWLYKFKGCPDVIWGYPTRADAEAAAFTAAFRVLENRLNEQGK